MVRGELRAARNCLELTRIGWWKGVHLYLPILRRTLGSSFLFSFFFSLSFCFFFFFEIRSLIKVSTVAEGGEERWKSQSRDLEVGVGGGKTGCPKAGSLGDTPPADTGDWGGCVTA